MKYITMKCVFDNSLNEIIKILEPFNIEYIKKDTTSRPYTCNTVFNSELKINKNNLLIAYNESKKDEFKYKIFKPLIEYIKINDFLQPTKKEHK